jgi:hypothetical protein
MVFLVMAVKESNYYVLIDGSGSMKNPAGPGFSGRRWEAVAEVAASLASEVAQSDPDGIGVLVFQGNHFKAFENQTDEASVQEIFRTMKPFGGTPLHLAVQYVVDRFVEQKGEVEPTFGIVLTDGVPDDKREVVRQLKRVGDFMKGKSLPDEMFTLWFIQVGDDPDGTAYLKLLDDEIAPAVGYDLVDTTPIGKLSTNIEEMVLKAIQD